MKIKTYKILSAGLTVQTKARQQIFQNCTIKPFAKSAFHLLTHF